MIISNNTYNEGFRDVVVCVISSNKFLDSYSFPILEVDLDLGFLPEPSVIKVHKLFTIQTDQILKKFTILSIQSFELVKEKLIGLIEVDKV